jgi:hypothetical protein
MPIVESVHDPGAEPCQVTSRGYTRGS